MDSNFESESRIQRFVANESFANPPAVERIGGSSGFFCDSLCQFNPVVL